MRTIRSSSVHGCALPEVLNVIQDVARYPGVFSNVHKVTARTLIGGNGSARFELSTVFGPVSIGVEIAKIEDGISIWTNQYPFKRLGVRMTCKKIGPNNTKISVIAQFETRTSVFDAIGLSFSNVIIRRLEKELAHALDKATKQK